MNNGTLVKINELRIDNDQFIKKLCLISPTKIIAVQAGRMVKQGPRLIGEELERELRMIVMEGNVRIFVEETVEELSELIGG